jgi:hypothetical protein
MLGIYSKPAAFIHALLLGTIRIIMRTKSFQETPLKQSMFLAFVGKARNGKKYRDLRTRMCNLKELKKEPKPKEQRS